MTVLVQCFTTKHESLFSTQESKLHQRGHSIVAQRSTFVICNQCQTYVELIKVTTLDGFGLVRAFFAFAFAPCAWCIFSARHKRSHDERWRTIIRVSRREKLLNEGQLVIELGCMLARVLNSDLVVHDVPCFDVQVLGPPRLILSGV